MKLTHTNQVASNIIEGLLLGYNPCCIAHHCTRQFDGTMVQDEHGRFLESKDSNHLWNGTGFICCEHCNSTKNAFQLHVEIAGRRFTKEPFPYAHTSGSEFEDLSNIPKEVIEEMRGIAPYVIGIIELHGVTLDSD